VAKGKRNGKKGGGGAPTWMVTFGDMMSLLLTFFVLLFTYSTMDVEKYKALAGSLKSAFGSSMMDHMRGMIEVGGIATRDTPTTMLIPPPEPKEHAGIPDSAEKPPVEMDLEKIDDKTIEETYKEVQKSRAEVLETELKTAIHQNLQGSRVGIERDGGKVVLRFPSEIAFKSGQADTNELFFDTLSRLIPILAATRGDIIISGHTDNVPISGGSFRSNWDLSAARATSVVHVLVDSNQIPAERITVQGFGDSRPLADNSTEEGRVKNRRVEIIILVQENGEPKQ
jgi:chemotaxis protein MotB